ncbi:alkaline phosphatase, putative [Plasmodium gallinaceum]|uniref:Alkaline phosphatase, putative n=1 Tax=Plasmodium gallinaceum TaxID=5849 RepID=A0A1J1GWN2_PLAGA|nr:alkaline phosphatase, putative [Plasmodium gallinaceum]CRG96671.1 alkaline phosphatase, putative [Plasmodium gallinaceum]
MKTRIKIFFIFFIFIKYVSSKADHIIHEKLTKFVFLSCNYQKSKKNEKLLESIEKIKPQLMLWIGDYFYSDCSELRCLDEAYNYIKKDPFYISLKEKFLIDGIYDDHDYNKNNGDRFYKYKEESKQKFLDYLNVDKNDVRYKRNGAYVSKLYIDPDNEKNQAKIIILDTRYNKDPYPFYAPDSYNDFFMCILISFLARFHSSIFGLHCNSKNDILGNEQWKWLENELTNSDARTHIIISSTQIFSNHVINENWGLMPYSLRRLKQLIKKTKPKGLIFLSGDVHFSSIIGNEDNIVEVTSSSVNQENVFSYLNKYFIYFFSSIINKRSAFELKNIYAFNNFGTVNINYIDDDEIRIKTSVNDSDGKEVLVANQIFNKKKNIYEKSDKLHVINDEFGTFMCKGKVKTFMHIIVYILFILWFIQILFILYKLFGIVKGSKVHKKKEV